MRYFGTVHYIVSSEEPLWFVVGLISGIIFMALVDFMIDRKKGKK